MRSHVPLVIILHIIASLLLTGPVSAHQNQQQQEQRHQKLVLVLSYEFVDPIFSGNGVHARTIVRSLDRLGFDTVTVSARPSDFITEYESLQSLKDLTASTQLHKVVTIPVNGSDWYSLGHNSAWHQFARTAWIPGSQQQQGEETYRRLHELFYGSEINGNGDASSPLVARFDAIITIDWHGALLLGFLGHEFPDLLQVNRPSICYMSFRVFSESKEMHASPLMGKFYRDVESFACSISDTVIALSRKDALSLERLLIQRRNDDGLNSIHDPDQTLDFQSDPFKGDYQIFTTMFGELIDHYLPGLTSPFQQFGVLMPPLRDDLEEQPKSGNSKSIFDNICPTDQPRCLLTCCVRLSPEKRAEHFVKVVNAMKNDTQTLGFRPLLCAHGMSHSKYAQETIGSLKSIWGRNAIILEQFLTSSELQQLFAKTFLNFHPPLSDAFGMTVAESAYFGAPSVVHYLPEFASNSSCINLDGSQDVRPAAGAIFPLVGQGRNNIESTDLNVIESLINTAPTVGVTELLRPECNESFAVSWSESPSSIAHQIGELFRSRQGLEKVQQTSSRSQTKVHGWTPADFDQALYHILVALNPHGHLV